MANGQEWWTDEKVESTVTKHFIYAHLRADAAERLTDPVFADLSDSTYLECILEKAKRLFLILIHLGVPGDILRLIEDSYDDDNLPIDEDDVTSLRLSRVRGQQIDSQFYRCQFKYLVRVIGEGEHIRYANAEVVPLHTVEQKIINSQNTIEKVKLPPPVNRVLLQKRISLNEDRPELDILSEIAGTKPLSHDHILSVFGSYVQDEQMYILMLPNTKYNLGQFLNDRPKAFEALPKPQRRSHYIMWPHCLANALAWLHDHDIHHGAIRPSRILIDENYQISLGPFEGDWALGSPTPSGDLESYQYAAPELWKRGLTLQSQTTSGTTPTFGGRSAVGRRDASRYVDEPHRQSDDFEVAPMKFSSMAGENTYTFVPRHKGVSSRLKLEISNDVMSPSINDIGRSDSRRQDRVDSPMGSIRRNNSLYRRYAPGSVKSSNSSDKNRRSVAYGSERMYSISGETKNTAVQTWTSTAENLPATDVFALAAVTMDMLTVLCSRAVSAFAKHRASKNRQAGRGGGLADSSFHANLPQVGTWAEALHKEADKKLKKNSGDVYRIVGPILQIIMQCLEREPQKRMSSVSLCKRMERHMADFAGATKPHCPPMLTHQSSTIRSQSVATVKPGILLVEKPANDQRSLNGRGVPGPKNARPNKERVRWDSNVSNSSSGRYTGSDSHESSTLYKQPPKIMENRGSDDPADLYELYGDDTQQEEDAYYVQVMPKDRLLGRRLRRDYTESDFDSSRAPSTAPSFITATTSLRGEGYRSYTTSDISSSTRTSHNIYMDYPPASPPPNRELPVSPPARLRIKSRSTNRSSTAPFADVHQANEFLAGAMEDLALTDRASIIPPLATHIRIDPDDLTDDDYDVVRVRR